MAQRLTDKLVQKLPAPASGNRVHYDSELAGFGLRVTAAGARSWVLNFRSRGRERRITIGSCPPWREKQARARAEELRREVDIGGDPMADRHAERIAPTVDDLASRFEAEHLSKRRSGTIRDYKGILTLHIRPALGRLKVAAVRHSDVEALHRKVAVSSPIRANRTVAVLSKMFALAIRWEMRGDNPARGIERRPEQKRTRYLTPAEIARLGAVLAVHAERSSANAVRLLLLTGALRGEVLGAEWCQFDLTAGVWVKPSATTKQKAEHRIPLSAPALALLTEMRGRAHGERFLFSGTGDAPLRDIKQFELVQGGLAGAGDARHALLSGGTGATGATGVFIGAPASARLRPTPPSRHIRGPLRPAPRSAPDAT